MVIDTDPLILAAKSYEKLLNKDFIITIDTKDGNKKNRIFNNVLQGNITYNSIENSSYFDNKIDDRVSYFHNIDKLLFEKVILDFDSCNVSLKTNLKCDYMFFKDDNGKYMHLSLAQDKIHYPESFFVRDDNIYIKNQDVFDIVSIKEIEKNKPKKSKKASNQS